VRIAVTPLPVAKLKTASVFRRWLGFTGLGLVAAGIGLSPSPVQAEDGLFGGNFIGNVEPYLRLGLGGGRIFDNNNDAALSLEDPIGETVISGTVGANLNRHVSAELAIDFVETNLNSRAFNKIAELAVWNFILQGRYRFPIGNRLEPYVLAGVGASFSEVNDTAVDARDHPLMDRKDLSVVGSVGAGIDYFIANNLALSAETKLLYGAHADMLFEGAERTLDMNDLITTVGLRMSVNAKDRETGGALPPAKDSDRWRVYLAMRATYPLYTDTSITPALHHDAAGNRELFGFSAGVNMGRYFGVEIAGEGGETGLISNTGAGDVAEFAFWTAAAQARLRYPVMGGRLSPYIVGGGGLAWTQVNDRNVPLEIFSVGGETESSPVATLGGGFDFFLAENIALNIEGRQTFFWERDLIVEGVPAPVDLSYFGLSGGIRVFFN
jgi:opacity protein-like surface antigen